MKKLFFIAALFFASTAADAQSSLELKESSTLPIDTVSLKAFALTRTVEVRTDVTLSELQARYTTYAELEKKALADLENIREHLAGLEAEIAEAKMLLKYKD